jgi:hypothetical protein
LTLGEYGVRIRVGQRPVPLHGEIMLKVQEIVRSMPWLLWTPGHSKCYVDTSYTKTKKKVRFKFDWIGTTAFDRLNAGREMSYGSPVGMDWSSPEGKDYSTKYNRIMNRLQKQLRDALEAEGHKVQLIGIHRGEVLVWMEPVSIVVTEVA